jgi:predicted DNA-binding protein with PD1-like motif
MQYTKGSIRRVYLVKFEPGEELIFKLKELAVKEKIRSASLIFLGALKDGSLVTGPKKAVIPPNPNKLSFKDGWEVLGLGTIFSNKSGPQLHLHVSMGKKRKVLTGCIRDNSKIFIVLEAVIFELAGIKATKELDPETGINLLKII